MTAKRINNRLKHRLNKCFVFQSEGFRRIHEFQHYSFIQIVHYEVRVDEKVLIMDQSGRNRLFHSYEKAELFIDSLTEIPIKMYNLITKSTI